MSNYTMDEMIKILHKATIFIPKSVAFRTDIYDESKTLFGVVFTQCVNDLRGYGAVINSEIVRKMMKAYVMDMEIADIQCECQCSSSKASAARSEVVSIIGKVNLGL